MTLGIASRLYPSQIANPQQRIKAVFQQLGTDLQFGNIAAAQQDSSAIRRSIQQTHAAPKYLLSTSGSSPSGSSGSFNLLTNPAAKATSIYGSAGLTSALTAGSILSQFI